jgi:CRISPR/Cas system-associated exonuclease Cas4 (RecB family)
MKPIRASEISTFLFCKRAWWYQRKGTVSINTELLAEGRELHQKHGRTVFVSNLLRTLGYFLLLVALVILTAYGTNLVLR